MKTGSILSLKHILIPIVILSIFLVGIIISTIIIIKKILRSEEK